MRMQPRARAAILSVLVVVGLLLSITQTRLSRGGNEISRFAVVEALVDHGRWTIEQSTFGRTADVIKMDGKVYSNKPPFQSLLAASGYWLCKHLFGWTIAEHRERVVYAVTLWSVGSFTLAFLLLLMKIYRDEALGPLLALTVVLGTTLLSFSGTLNNHTPAAFLLLWGLWEARRERATRAGIALGACFLFDPIFAGVFGLMLGIAWLRDGRKLLGYALGAVPLLGFWFLLNAIATGSLLPLLMTPARPGVDKSWSPSGFVLPQGWSYPFHALFGLRGFFVYSPLFLTAALVWRPVREQLRTHLLDRLILAGVVLTVAIHMLIAGGYGGWAFGYRYLIPLVAPFALLAPTIWRSHPLAWSLAFVPSFLLALLGSYAPWVPSYQREGIGKPIAARIRFNAGANLACFAMEHGLPGAAQLERWFIDEDHARALEYERFFFHVRGDDEP